MTEANLVDTGAGLRADEAGWYVLNARDAPWLEGHFGAYTRLGEGDERFPELGINIGVLAPGQPACYYHGEGAQEGFLVLSGEALLLVEGEERPLRAWDYVHCPPWTEHVLVGAGDGPCAILAVGSRPDGGVVYPVSEVAQQYGAGVEAEVAEGTSAYAGLPPDRPAGFRDGWL